MALRDPMGALIEEMDARFVSFAPEMTGDPRCSMFRIHRDTRFSRDKSPYKTHASCWFRHRGADHRVGSEAEGGSAGLYFHVEPGKSRSLRRHVDAAPSGTQQDRDAIAEDHKGLLRVLQNPAFRRRFGDLDYEAMLKRMPRGFAEDHPAASSWAPISKSFTISRNLTDKQVLNPRVVKLLEGEFKLMMPLVRWLNGALGLQNSRQSKSSVFILHVHQSFTFQAMTLIKLKWPWRLRHQEIRTVDCRLMTDRLRYYRPPIEPMLAKLADALPERRKVLFEPKWDGFRASCFRSASDVFIQSRDLKPLDRYFPELHDALLEALPEGLCDRWGDRDRERVRAWTSTRCRCDCTQPRHGWPSWPRRRRPPSSHSTCWRLTARAAWTTTSRAPRLLERLLGEGGPPVYLTPMTRDHSIAVEWLQASRARDWMG